MTEIEAVSIGRRSTNPERWPITLVLDTARPITLEVLLASEVSIDLSSRAHSSTSQRQKAPRIAHI
jgi:hypothetical protein